MKIGSQEFAEIALTINEDVPEGWESLGCGSYRMAFQGPDGFVYKRDMHFAGINGNDKEYDTFTQLVQRGISWVPQFTLYKVNKDTSIMVVQYLRDIFYQDWYVSGNKQRYNEISSLVMDSGDENTGVDPTTGLVFLRDGGSGLLRYL